MRDLIVKETYGRGFDLNINAMITSGIQIPDGVYGLSDPIEIGGEIHIGDVALIADLKMERMVLIHPSATGSIGNILLDKNHKAELGVVSNNRRDVNEIPVGLRIGSISYFNDGQIDREKSIRELLCDAGLSSTPWDKPTYEYGGWAPTVEALADRYLKYATLRDGKVDLTTAQFRNLIADVWITGKED
jgi:hypothetical protein